jgi:transcriptional regulator of PTS gene
MSKQDQHVRQLVENLQNELPIHRKVLGLIRRRGFVTRQDVAQYFGWLQPSTSKVIKSLTDKKLISIQAMRRDEADRRRDYLCINPELGHAFGVELDGLRYRIALYRIDGEIIDQSDFYSIKGMPPEQTLREVAEKVLQMQKVHKNLKVLGMGMAYMEVHNDPDDPSKPVSETEQWLNVPIQQILESHTGLPVSVIDDLSACLLAELRYGHALDRRNIFYLSMKGGIGLGLLSNGRVHRGHNNDSGEFGHICIDPDGDYCHCGGRGCLETVASSWAIIRQVRDLMEKGIAPMLSRKFQEQAITLELISQQADEGVVLAENIMEKAGETIGNLLSMFANCLDPELNILSGILSHEENHRILVSSLKRAFHKGLYPSRRSEVSILPTKLGTHASLVGSAAAVFEALMPSYPIQLFKPFCGDEEEFSRHAE